MKTTWSRADFSEHGRAFECDRCKKVVSMTTGHPRVECECQGKPLPGDVITYTSAPADYDWYYTTEIGVVGKDGRGLNVRKVSSPERHFEAQRDRYTSGLHFAIDEAEWEKRVSLKLVTANT